MITKFIHADGQAENAVIRKIHNRRTILQLQEDAFQIVRDVQNEGYEAVEKYSLQFDHAEPREMEPQELEDAADRLDTSLMHALERASKNIYEYYTGKQDKDRTMKCPVPGGNVGQKVRGMHRIAIYVPSSDEGCVTTVLLNAIPARIAGVDEIILITPPAEKISDNVLAAAWAADIDRVILLGGAQAVAALTFGAGFIPRVDKIVGCPDAMARTAGIIVNDFIDVSFTDENQELCVVADETANPVWVAADMLSQAERTVQSAAVLFTNSEDLANSVMQELDHQSAALRRRAIMQQSLADYGAVVVCDDIYACIRLANDLAPAHLELFTAAPLALLDDVQTAGCISLGANSPEILGRFAAGAGSIRLASGAARFASPTDVSDFQKHTTLIKFSDEALETLSQDMITLSRSEALTANANVIKVRL